MKGQNSVEVPMVVLILLLIESLNNKLYHAQKFDVFLSGRIFQKAVKARPTSSVIFALEIFPFVSSISEKLQ